MFGWVSRARRLPSWRNRSSPLLPMSAVFSSFTAALRVKRPSLRSASHTVPMPPRPRGDTRL